MIKILIVEDDPFLRLYIKKTLAMDPTIQIIGEAEDGGKAVELAASLAPDVITMDVGLPVQDGVAATRQIMARSPCPVIMVSAFTQEDTGTTVAALEAGAVDFVSKSSRHLGMDIAHIETALREKLRFWATCPPVEAQRMRKENLERLKTIQARLKSAG